MLIYYNKLACRPAIYYIMPQHHTRSFYEFSRQVNSDGRVTVALKIAIIFVRQIRLRTEKLRTMWEGRLNIPRWIKLSL